MGDAEEVDGGDELAAVTDVDGGARAEGVEEEEESGERRGREHRPVHTARRVKGSTRPSRGPAAGAPFG